MFVSSDRGVPKAPLHSRKKGRAGDDSMIMHDRYGLKMVAPKDLCILVNKEDAVVNRLFNQVLVHAIVNHATRRSFCGPGALLF